MKTQKQQRDNETRPFLRFARSVPLLWSLVVHSITVQYCPRRRIQFYAGGATGRGLFAQGRLASVALLVWHYMSVYFA